MQSRRWPYDQVDGRNGVCGDFQFGRTTWEAISPVEWWPRTKFWLSPYDANLRNSMHGHRQFKKSRPCYTFFESRRNIVTPQYISMRAKNIPNVKKTITQLLFLADCQNARHLSGSSFDFTKVYQLFATKCFGIVTDKNILIFSDRRGKSW